MKGIVDHYIISLNKIEKEIIRELKKEETILREIDKLEENFTVDEAS